MKFYEEMAEIYIGVDVSPDFYGWVFPKNDHVGVGTGTASTAPPSTRIRRLSATVLLTRFLEGRLLRLRHTLFLKTTTLIVFKVVLRLSVMLLDMFWIGNLLH
jgi:hypothetical protein